VSGRFRPRCSSGSSPNGKCSSNWVLLMQRAYRMRRAGFGRNKCAPSECSCLSTLAAFSGGVRSTEVRFCWIAAIQSRSQLANALFSLTLGVMGSLRANSHTTGPLRTVELGVLTDRALKKSLALEIRRVVRCGLGVVFQQPASSFANYATWRDRASFCERSNLTVPESEDGNNSCGGS
jgi:hypothetical protein